MPCRELARTESKKLGRDAVQPRAIFVSRLSSVSHYILWSRSAQSSRRMALHSGVRTSWRLARDRMGLCHHDFAVNRLEFP